MEAISGKLTAWLNRKWMENFLSEFSPEDQEEAMRDLSDLDISIVRQKVYLMSPSSYSAKLSGTLKKKKQGSYFR